MTVQGGITLNDLHVVLAQNNLAMSNVGSISEQTLAGVVTTATHASGIHFGVISTSVISLTLLLADGSHRLCSRVDNQDLFLATLCGLGATGIILSVQLKVEPAFRLKEVQKNLGFQEMMIHLDNHVYGAEHVRFWWYPTKDVVRASYSDRTIEVCIMLVLVTIPDFSSPVFRPKNQLVVGSGKPSSDTTSSSSYSSSQDTSPSSSTTSLISHVGCLEVIQLG